MVENPNIYIYYMYLYIHLNLYYIVPEIYVSVPSTPSQVCGVSWSGPHQGLEVSQVTLALWIVLFFGGFLMFNLYIYIYIYTHIYI